MRLPIHEGMADEKFDIKQWLLDADTSRVDDSLDEDAKRLFVLNDALVNPDYGPILAALIVTAEADCGLDALTELADCSEPRLAMMAIVNTLNILTRAGLDDSEFVVPNTANSSGEDISISRDDLPSESFVVAKVTPALLQMSKLFVDTVDAGDFCPDFLIFLLTALMNISVRQEGKQIGEHEQQIMSVPTERFLKTIMRSWKTSELSQHRSEADDENGFNLGFLVTCYLKSLCVTGTKQGESDITAVSTNETGQPVGIRALINIGDWAVKFILMRLYTHTVDAAERAQLMTVMDHCAHRSEDFTKNLLRESAVVAIWRIAAEEDRSRHIYDSMSRADMMPLLRITVPAILLLNHFAHHLLRGAVVPGAGIWFENNQTRITLSLCRAFAKIVKQGMRLILLSDFPSSDDGLDECDALILLVSHLIAQVWKAGVAVLFRASIPQRPLRERFMNLLGSLSTTAETLCFCRNLQWEEVSQLNSMATLRVGINAVSALKQNIDTLQRMKSGEHVREMEFLERESYGDLCEWCLSPGDGPSMACGQCKKVSYCCVEHQRAHWTQGHKAECKFFRNCLEGSSCSYGERGRLEGLNRIECDTADPSAPFGDIACAQRNELLVLGYRLPGVMIEKRGLRGTKEVFYRSKSATLEAISELSRSRERTTHNLLISESLMSTSCTTSSMLYMHHDGGPEQVSILSLHCASKDYSQSLSVRLVP